MLKPGMYDSSQTWAEFNSFDALEIGFRLLVGLMLQILFAESTIIFASTEE